MWIVDIHQNSATPERTAKSPFFQTFSKFLKGIGLPSSHWEDLLSKLDYGCIDARWRVVASLTGSRPDTPERPWGYVSNCYLFCSIVSSRLTEVILGCVRASSYRAGSQTRKVRKTSSGMSRFQYRLVHKSIPQSLPRRLAWCVATRRISSDSGALPHSEIRDRVSRWCQREVHCSIREISHC